MPNSMFQERMYVLLIEPSGRVKIDRKGGVMMKKQYSKPRVVAAAVVHPC